MHINPRDVDYLPTSHFKAISMSPPNPLLQLHCLEPSSPQFPAEIATILEGTDYKFTVKFLQGRNVEWLVDYLDRVCLEHPLIPSFSTSA